jgi:hypothetical protein
VIVQKDYLHGLEERVKKLEESYVAVRGDVDGLVAREQGSGLSRGDEDGRASVPDLIGTEDEVDAMGAVTFADEEDSGFFGMVSFIALSFQTLLIWSRPFFEYCFLKAFVSSCCAARVPSIPWCCRRWLCECFATALSAVEESWSG